MCCASRSKSSAALAGEARWPRRPDTGYFGRDPVGNGQAPVGFRADFIPGVAAVEGAGAETAGGGTSFFSAGLGAATGLGAAAFGAAFFATGFAAAFGAAFFATGLAAAFGAAFFATGLAAAFGAAFFATGLAAAFGAAFFATGFAAAFGAAFFTAGLAAGFFVLVAMSISFKNHSRNMSSSKALRDCDPAKPNHSTGALERR